MQSKPSGQHSPIRPGGVLGPGGNADQQMQQQRTPQQPSLLRPLLVEVPSQEPLGWDEEGQVAQEGGGGTPPSVFATMALPLDSSDEEDAVDERPEFGKRRVRRTYSRLQRQQRLAAYMSAQHSMQILQQQQQQPRESGGPLPSTRTSASIAAAGPRIGGPLPSTHTSVAAVGPGTRAGAPADAAAAAAGPAASQQLQQQSTLLRQQGTLLQEQQRLQQQSTLLQERLQQQQQQAPSWHQQDTAADVLQPAVQSQPHVFHAVSSKFLGGRATDETVKAAAWREKRAADLQREMVLLQELMGDCVQSVKQHELPWFDKGEVWYYTAGFVVALLAMMLLLVAAGLLSGAHQVSKAQLYRLLIFFGGMPFIWMLVNALTWVLILVVEGAYYRQALFHHVDMRRCLNLFITTATLLLWFRLTSRFSPCPGGGSDCRQKLDDESSTLGMVVWRLTLCGFLFSLVVLVTGILSLMLANRFYNTFHYNKVTAVLYKQYWLVMLCQPRSKLLCRDETMSEPDSELGRRASALSAVWRRRSHSKGSSSKEHKGVCDDAPAKPVLSGAFLGLSPKQREQLLPSHTTGPAAKPGGGVANTEAPSPFVAATAGHSAAAAAAANAGPAAAAAADAPVHVHTDQARSPRSAPRASTSSSSSSPIKGQGSPTAGTSSGSSGDGHGSSGLGSSQDAREHWPRQGVTALQPPVPRLTSVDEGDEGASNTASGRVGSGSSAGRQGLPGRQAASPGASPDAATQAYKDRMGYLRRKMSHLPQHVQYGQQAQQGQQGQQQQLPVPRSGGRPGANSSFTGGNSFGGAGSFVGASGRSAMLLSQIMPSGWGVFDFGTAANRAFITAGAAAEAVQGLPGDPLLHTGVLETLNIRLAGKPFDPRALKPAAWWRVRAGLAIQIHEVLVKRYTGGKEEEERQIKAARRLGKLLFQHIKGDATRQYITRADFEPFFAGCRNAEAEADAAFCFFDVENTAMITQSVMADQLAAIVRQRQDMATSLRDISSIARAMEFGIAAVLNIMFLLVYLAVWQVDVSKFFTSITGALLFTSFMFANSAKNVFEAVLFLLSAHAFDVGDMVRIDHTMYRVTKLRLLYTVLQMDTCELVVYPNSKLLSLPIINLSANEILPYDKVVVSVDAGEVSRVAARALKAALDEHFETEEWQRNLNMAPNVFVTNVAGHCLEHQGETVFKTEITVDWTYNFGPTEETRAMKVKSALLDVVSDTLAQLPELMQQHAAGSATQPVEEQGTAQ